MYFTVIWSITSGSSDYLYYYGEGNLDKVHNTFTVGFNEELPPEATNKYDKDNALSVGVVILSTTQTKRSGIDSSHTFPAPDLKFYGILNLAGLIYIKGEPAKLDLGPTPWVHAFKPGYNFGKGVRVPRNGFDYFIPVDTKEMELVIDTTFSNKYIVNWTGIKPHNSHVQ